MRRSTVTSLRTRLREYENDTLQINNEADLRFVHPRGDESDAAFEQRRKDWIEARQLRLRCNFLEDTLKVYQGELQYHVGEEKRDRKDFEKDVIKEMEVLDETNKAVMRQLRQSQVEVESMHDVQDEMQKRTSVHFERLLARQKERSENERRILENENTALRLRVSQLETSLANWKHLEETEATTEANDANYKLSMLREEVKEKNQEVKRSIQHQQKLENSLAQCREQLALVLDFIDGCGGSAQRVGLTIKQVSREHHRLVNRLLNIANDDLFTTSNNDNNNSKRDSSPVRTDEYDDHEYHDDGDDGQQHHVVNSEGIVVATTSSSSADRATNEVVRLQRAVDKICQVIHDQHVEMSLAIDAAATVWEGERKQLELKHRETMSHAQTLQTRIQVVERQSAAAQEEAMAERDRALQLRDQAVVFLRAKDVKENRMPMRHADVQTMMTMSNMNSESGFWSNSPNNNNNNNVSTNENSPNGENGTNQQQQQQRR